MVDRAKNDPSPNLSSLTQMGNPVLSIIERGSSLKLHSDCRSGEFMIRRRFALLHHQALQKRQQEINEQGQTLKGLWGDENDGDRQFQICGGLETADRKSHKWFLAKIKGRLHPFSESSQQSRSIGTVMLTTVPQIRSF